MDTNEQKLQKWLEFTQKIFSSLEMDQTARTIMDIGRRYFEHSRCLISLLERHFIRRPTVEAVKALIGLRPMSR